MDELARELDLVRDELLNLAPSWDEDRSARLFAGVARLQQKRRLERAGIGMLLMAATGVLLAVGYREYRAPQPTAADNTALVATAARTSARVSPSERQRVAPAPIHVSVTLPAGRQARLADGSLVQVAQAEGSLQIVRNVSNQIELRLMSGAAHFDVVPNHERSFQVEAGDVRVGVLGTVFDVERSYDRVRVSVSEGRVRVTRGDDEQLVSAGEARWFGPHEAFHEASHEASELDDADAVGDEPVDQHAAADKKHAHKNVHAIARAQAPAQSSWRSLSQAGDYEAAYRSLSQGPAIEDDAATLMDAADAARLSEHPEAAVSYLRRVTKDHRQSPVAPLAAFTLGRVLLERLGQPSEAAESFALARALAPHGSLAQDALAREVEALSKAGNAHEAYLRAQQYVEAYPTGRRLRAVQLYGGLSN